MEQNSLSLTGHMLPTRQNKLEEERLWYHLNICTHNVWRQSEQMAAKIGVVNAFGQLFEQTHHIQNNRFSCFTLSIWNETL